MDWPSSCVRLKLMASIRSWYALLLLTSEKRPMRWLDFMPSSISSGRTKVPNMSSSMPLQPSSITRMMSTFTSVVKTIGLLPLDLGRVVDVAHHLVGLVHAVDERQAHVARIELELGQDGVAEGFGRDAGAVGNEEYGAGVHGSGL